jgi:hypothetical protein
MGNRRCLPLLFIIHFLSLDYSVLHIPFTVLHIPLLSRNISILNYLPLYCTLLSDATFKDQEIGMTIHAGSRKVENEQASLLSADSRRNAFFIARYAEHIRMFTVAMSESNESPSAEFLGCYTRLLIMFVVFAEMLSAR